MKIDDSNKSYSYLIAGILIISVLSIFLAFALGNGSVFNLEQNAVNSTALQKTQDNNLLYTGNDICVSIAQKRDWNDLDTAEGHLKILEHNIPDFETQGVPLCIDDALVANWYVLVESKGGYHPVTCGTRIDIYQEKTYADGSVVRDWLGYIKVTWTIELDPPCCTVIYRANFDVFSDDASDPDCIHIESNKFPESSIIPPWRLEKCVPDTQDLDKWVDIELKSKWAVCGDSSQCFEIILIPKNKFPGSPIPD
jgi:hypothetical protein